MSTPLYYNDVVINWPHLNEPHLVNPSDPPEKAKYSLELVLPANHPMVATTRAAVEEEQKALVAATKRGTKAPPFYPAAEKYPEDPYMADKVIIRTTSPQQPQLGNAQGQQVTSLPVRAGDACNVWLNCAPYRHPTGNGVSFFLNAVQLTRQGVAEIQGAQATVKFEPVPGAPAPTGFVAGVPGPGPGPGPDALS